MRLKSDFKYCSICLEEKVLTFEHIIPKSIGGILESDIQCADCNNKKLGSKLISRAKKTYTIRLAINKLKQNLPQLFKKIEQGQEYIAYKSDNSISSALFKDGILKSKNELMDNGTLNIDRSDTEKKLSEILTKEGLSEEEVNQKIEEFQNIDIEKMHKLTSITSVIKRKFIRWHQKPSSTLLEDRVVALIAYNYLCLAIGEIIIDPRMNFFRDFILNGIKTDKIIINQIPYTNEYKPYHKILSEPSETEVKVTIVLFGSIISFVTVKNLGIPKDYNWILVQDLENR